MIRLLTLSLTLISLTPQTKYARPELLVETDWLAAHINDANVRVVDMRTRGFETSHIPRAMLLANDAIKVQANAPTFLPTVEQFTKTLEGLGITSKTRVVVYDDRGGIYAARLWFILNAFGHTNVALLNGGWTKWMAENRESSNAVIKIEPVPYGAKLAVIPHWVATAADVVAVIDKPGSKIVDARTPNEIAGTDLRGIKRGGAIPSSVPVYWEDALNTTTRAFKSQDEIAKLWSDKGIGATDDVITYCQVGMRASVDLFALHLLGYDKLRNYYGAWEEWGNRDDLPISKK